jgi:hypothetical protein
MSPAPAALGLGPFLCPAGTTGTRSYEVATELAYHPIVEPSAAGTPGDIAMRHCLCDEPHGSEAERRANCGFGTSWDCEIDSLRFIAPPFNDMTWQRMSLGGQPPSADFRTVATFGPATELPSASVSWDSIADLELLTGVPLPPTPWTINGGVIVGGPVLDGIGWSFVPELDGEETSALVDPYDRSYDDFASHYLPVDQRFVANCNCETLPETAPPFPWEYCDMCGPTEEAGFIEIVNPELALSIEPSRTREISAGMTPQARAVLSAARELSHQRQPAAEPEYRLVQGRIARREIVVDPETLGVMGHLTVTGGKIDGASRVPVGLEEADSVFESAFDEEALHPGASAFFSYSASRDQLFALARDAAGAVSLGFWSGSDELWRALPLLARQPLSPNVQIVCDEGGSCSDETEAPMCPPGGGGAGPQTTSWVHVDDVPEHLVNGYTLGACSVAIGEILATTFHQEHDALYVLDLPDETPNSPRLVRIELLSGVVTVIKADIAATLPGQLSLSVGYDRELLVVTTVEGGSCFTHLVVSGETASFAGERFTDEAPHAGGLVLENRLGAHYLTAVGESFKPRVALRSEFAGEASGKPCSLTP